MHESSMENSLRRRCVRVSRVCWAQFRETTVRKCARVSAMSAGICMRGLIVDLALSQVAPFMEPGV